MKLHVLAFVIVLLGLTVARAAEPFQWGVNGHPLSQETYFHVPITTQLDLVQKLGAGWYRVDCYAEAFRANPTRFDELVVEATRRKIRLLPVLLASPNVGSPTATLEEIRRAARQFAKSIVSRYKDRITHWELSNELDIQAMIRQGEKTRSGKTWSWAGGADGDSPDHYEEGRYQKAKAEILGLSEGVKEADPAAQTLVDAAGWLHDGFIVRLVKEDHVPFDILAWHWYSEMGDMTRVRGTINLLERLKGYGKPIWITEINRRNGSLGDETDQAKYIASVARLAADPAIGALFVYEILDEPHHGADNGESHYGLVELARDPENHWKVKRRKAAFETFQRAVSGTK